MNLLKDPFISTTQGKVSLKELLTSSCDYQLQYYFDEAQLAMLQLLSSLATVVLKPDLEQLEQYIVQGVTAEQYDTCLAKVETKWFDGDCFMQSPMPSNAKIAEGPITKLVSGIECGGSANALGLFSEVEQADMVCPDCVHVLNYNLHMNIKAEYFGPTGATGIRGGGAISTLIAGSSLRETILANMIAYDFFNQSAQLDQDAESRLMWDLPPQGKTYFSPKIGLERGLFALAYHIQFPVEDKECVCDLCGQQSDKTVTTFRRLKYGGSYGSTKSGRDAHAGWWLHPYTPRTLREDGTYPVCARDQHWQSWQELTSYVVGTETNKAAVKPAYIVNQFCEIGIAGHRNLLIGGNIADQGSVIGRIYDLYSMPASLAKNLSKVTKVIEEGLAEKDKLSKALNKIFGIGYDKNFVAGIKESAIQRYTSNAQQIIQQILLDVDRKEAAQLRSDATKQLHKEAKRVFTDVQQKYQYDLPLFKALVKGELVLNKSTKKE